MKEDTIRHLLEKYYNGETDVNEEKILEDYFMHDEVSAEFSVDKGVFCRLAEIKENDEPTVPEGMEKRISDNIDMWEKQSKADKPRYYTLYKYVSGIAAAVVILIGISVFMPKNQEDSTAMKDTFDNPQEAYVKEKIDNIKNFRR